MNIAQSFELAFLFCRVPFSTCAKLVSAFPFVNLCAQCERPEFKFGGVRMWRVSRVFVRSFDAFPVLHAIKPRSIFFFCERKNMNKWATKWRRLPPEKNNQIMIEDKNKWDWEWREETKSLVDSKASSAKKKTQTYSCMDIWPVWPIVAHIPDIRSLAYAYTHTSHMNATNEFAYRADE